MDASEKEICAYLKSWVGQFVSGREIARRAGGKSKFREDPEWSVHVLARLVEKGLIESDATGHYRLKPEDPSKKKKKKWVSPHIKSILKSSGKDFDQVIQVDGADD